MRNNPDFDGVAGLQCVDIAKVAIYWKNPANRGYTFNGSAQNGWHDFGKPNVVANTNDYQKIVDEGDLIPEIGDILFWVGGEYGHTAVMLESGMMLEQNFGKTNQEKLATVRMFAKNRGNLKFVGVLRPIFDNYIGNNNTSQTDAIEDYLTPIYQNDPIGEDRIKQAIHTKDIRYIVFALSDKYLNIKKELDDCKINEVDTDGEKFVLKIWNNLGTVWQKTIVDATTLFGMVVSILYTVNESTISSFVDSILGVTPYSKQISGFLFLVIVAIRSKLTIKDDKA